MRPFPSFDPAKIPSGTIDTKGVNNNEQLVIYNISLSSIQLVFNDQTTDVIPPLWAKSWIKSSGPMGLIRYATQFIYNIDPAQMPYSIFYGTIYEKGEYVQNINGPIPIVINSGNQLPPPGSGSGGTPVTTQVINIGNTLQTVLQAQLAGNTDNDALILNDGSASFRNLAIGLQAISMGGQSGGYIATPKTTDSAGINAVLQSQFNLTLPPTIILPPAVYSISSSILIPGNNTTIIMMPGAILNAVTGLNDYIIKSTPASGVLVDNVHIYGGQLVCNAANQTSGGGIDAKGSSRWHIENVWVEAPYEIGIYLRDSGGTFGFQNWVKHCRIMDGYLSAGDGRGIDILNNDENNILECFMQSMGGTGGNDPNYITDRNGLNRVSGCTFVSNGFGHKLAAGVKCYATATGSRIDHNQFDGVKYNNIHLVGGRNQVVDNNFLNFGFNNAASGANTVNGIYSGGLDNLIKMNEFQPAGDAANAARAAVLLDGTAGEGSNIVSDNVFQAINTGGSQILILGSPTGNTTTPNIQH